MTELPEISFLPHATSPVNDKHINWAIFDQFWPIIEQPLEIILIILQILNECLHLKKTCLSIHESYRKIEYNCLQMLHLASILVCKTGLADRISARPGFLVLTSVHCSGLGKTKFCQELADELDMLFVPGASMEEFYINPYGYDLRELDPLVKHTK